MSSAFQTQPFWIRQGQPTVVLAPMDGVIDPPMRAFLSQFPGIDLCVSEFIRVSQEIPPTHFFLREVPELSRGGLTSSGIPVQIQLLGGDPEKLAEAAYQACQAGAWGVDLNFGCPAPTVNRHDGGATLLKSPERIRGIIESVRKAVPKSYPVSAKMRLGWDSIDAIHANAESAAQGGASWLTIHGRTKVQGYAPPAYWRPIGEVRQRLGKVMPIVANGEIWTYSDFIRCRDETGCEHFMLGRGAMADIALPAKIKKALQGEAVLEKAQAPSHSTEEWIRLFEKYAEICRSHQMGEGYILRRIKQWAGLVARKWPLPWIEPLKRQETLVAAFELLTSFKLTI